MDKFAIQLTIYPRGCYPVPMIPRTISKPILEDAAGYPVVGVLGPRQSGKTTLVRSLFHDMHYSNLEDPETRAFAEQDPKAFLSSPGRGMIIDEFQRVPQLLSYIQVLVDERQVPGQFVLTGSQNFLMMETISQSLAGRIALFSLLPLSLAELQQAGIELTDSAAVQFRGLFPRLFTVDLDIGRFYGNYVQTYLERDVRQLKNIADLAQFHTFLQLCAGRVGQVVNLSSLGDDVGISQNTVKSWLGLLEASHIVFMLRPFYRNFSKQIIKSHKLYFYDCGLAAYLLGIHNSDEYTTHHAKGCLFENFVILELIKYFFNQGRRPACYFWRDKRGREVDLLIDCGQIHRAVEIKAGQTVSGSWFDNLRYYANLDPVCSAQHCYIVYGGSEEQKRTAGTVLPWHALTDPGEAFSLT